MLSGAAIRIMLAMPRKMRSGSFIEFNVPGSNCLCFNDTSTLNNEPGLDLFIISQNSGYPPVFNELIKDGESYFGLTWNILNAP